MKLSAYIVRFDSGFAPNPFHGLCTLACCKPTIRRKAECGDIVVGTASTRYKRAGSLIYAMRVDKVLPYEEYWKAYDDRKPSQATPITRRGDNIWHKDRSGEWRVADGARHDESARERDTGGENVLISTHFFYFGRKAIAIPADFTRLLATTQGHKNTYEFDVISRFWDWLCCKAPKWGRIGDPSDFEDARCCAQCLGVEDDDITENETSPKVGC